MRGRCDLDVVVGLHLPDTLALRGEPDAERAEDGQELVEADPGGIAELE